jgi:hypothetical protein
MIPTKPETKPELMEVDSVTTTLWRFATWLNEETRYLIQWISRN